MEVANNQLDNSEVELYDRQVRLWGIEAQTMMKAARIAITGLDHPSSTETARHLVLSGINLTLIGDLT